MCWRTLSKNENVRWLFSLAPGCQTAMKEPLWPVAFAPPPAPSPTAQTPLGRGRKMGALQAGATRLQSPTKKVPLSPAPRGGKGPGDRGQKLILNLQRSPGNLAFFSQWRHLCHTSDFFADLLTADSLISIFEGDAMCRRTLSKNENVR